jgi:hypothetical protein
MTPAPLSTGSHRDLALRAADQAETVLSVFQADRPEDPRPALAIAAARAWARGEIACAEARAAAFAAHAAARQASSSFAAAAARAAGHAAATAHVVGHARHAADYARKAAAGLGP